MENKNLTRLQALDGMYYMSDDGFLYREAKGQITPIPIKTQIKTKYKYFVVQRDKQKYYFFQDDLLKKKGHTRPRLSL